MGSVWICLLLLLHIYTLPVTNKVIDTYIFYKLASFKTIICSGWVVVGVAGVGGGRGG